MWPTIHLYDVAILVYCPQMWVPGGVIYTYIYVYICTRYVFIYVYSHPGVDRREFLVLPIFFLLQDGLHIYVFICLHACIHIYTYISYIYMYLNK